MRPTVIIGTLLTLSGCIFGGSDEPDDPIIVNNTNSGTNNGEELQVATATLNELDCTPNTPRFVIPAAPAGYGLTGESVVDFSGQPAKAGLTLAPGFSSSLAWASVTDGELRVTIAGLRTDSGDAPQQYWTGTLSVGDDVELYFIDLDPRLTLNVVGGVVFETTIGTSDGIRECVFQIETISPNYELAADCSGAFLQDRLKDVQAPEYVDFVPILSDEGDEYVVNLSNASALVTTSGRGPRDLNYFEAVHYDTEARLFSPISTSEAVEPTLTPPEVFAVRMGWGVGEAEGGWPVIQLLARGLDGEYAPRVLVHGADGYVEQDLGDWPLPPDVDIDRRTFTFLDGYDAEAQPWEAGDGEGGGISVDPARSEVRHGYAALSNDGARLLLSRPGGLLADAVDLVETELGGAASEIRVIRNIPYARQLGTVANPIMVVVDGEDREQVSLIEWDFQTKVTVLRDALRGGFTDVGHISVPTLLSTQSGLMAFVARRSGELGIGLFPFESDPDDPSSRFDANVCADK